MLYGAHAALAIVFIAGIVVAAGLNLKGLRASRPSGVARAFSRVRPLALVVTLALLALLVTGLFLVRDKGYSYGDGWIVAVLVLWVVANALGGLGGKRDRETRRLAERLAAEGDEPSAELRARVRDPASLMLSYGAGVAGVAILVLMLVRP